MRQEKLIAFIDLLEKENKYKQSDFFAAELKVNVKTIRNYILDLTYLMKNLDLNIDRRSGVGIMLVGSRKQVELLKKNIKKDYNMQYSTSERRNEIIEELLMFDGHVSVRKLSERYDVSRSSIVYDIEVISKELKKLELSIIKTNKGTYLEAKEQRIRSAKRRFIYHKVNQSADTNEYAGKEAYEEQLAEYVNVDFINEAKQLISYITSELCFTIENNYYIQILVQFSIFLDRITKNHKLVSTPSRPVVTELHILKTYPIALNVCHHIENKYNVEIGELDIRWINARIAGVFHERRTFDNLKDNPMIDKIVEDLLNSVKDIFNTDLSEDIILTQGLKKHFVPMIARLSNNIKVSNPFIEQIKQQYTAMFSVIWLASSIIEKEIGYQLSEDEVSFILIHFQAAMERRDLSKKIALVSNTSAIQSQLVVSRIKSSLPTFDVIEVLDENAFYEINTEMFDFFISTIPLDNKEILSIMISPIASNEDIKKVKLFYEENFLKIDGPKYMNVLEAIEDDTILLKKTYSNPESLLKSACSLLLDKKVVNEGFYDSVMERENNSPTELGHGVAIPHGKDFLVNKNKIVFITLAEPIIWGKQEVDIVILLAINFNDKEFSRKIFKDLYHMMNHDEFIKKLSSCKTIEEFKSIFKEPSQI